MSMKMVRDPYGTVHGPFCRQVAEALAADLVRDSQSRGGLSQGVSIEDTPPESPRVEVHLAGAKQELHFTALQIDEIASRLGRRGLLKP